MLRSAGRLARQQLLANAGRTARSIVSTPLPESAEEDEGVQEETARTAISKSCYLKIDFKISENASAFDAIKRMAGHRIGALAVTEGSDTNSKVVGVFSERDYLTKVALHGKVSKETLVSEVCTYGEANLVVVDADDSIDECMQKMLGRDIRHLLIRDEHGKIISMLSIKDLVKVTVAKNEEIIRKLTDLALGKGAFYGSD